MDGLVGEMRRGHLVVEFTDQYGDKRVIHRTKGARLSVKRTGNTPAHAMNRAAAIEIGENIRARRQALGMTMDDLCRRAGLAAAPGQGKMRIYEIEKATRQQAMRIGTLYALAMALECEVSDLLPTVRAVSNAGGVSFETFVGLAT